MASIDELEARIQRDADPDTLAVYADALQAAGDPRGELIAIDLELGRLRVTANAREDRRTDLARFDALVGRKRELLTAWVGDQVGQQPWHPRNFEHGAFRGAGVASIPASSSKAYLTSILDSPVGDRIAEISLYGNKTEIDDMLDLVIARPLRWLRKLAIYRFEVKGPTKPITKRRWAAAIAATPNVDDLTLIGTGVAATVHPTVRTLRLPGATGLAVSAPLLQVTTLDVGLHPPHGHEQLVPENCVALAGVVNPRTFPALRHLDLATRRNDGQLYVAAQQPAPWPQPVILGPMIDAIEDLQRLESLRLPSLRDTDQHAYIRALADRLPSTTIEIARMWTTLDVPVHPRIRIPPARGWPSGAGGRDALSIKVPTHPYNEELALSSLIDDLDGQFDDMLIEAQDAWLELWDFLEDLPWEDDEGNAIKMPFPAATLLRALDALDGNGRCDRVAAMLREPKLPPEAEVLIERYWGW